MESGATLGAAMLSSAPGRTGASMSSKVAWHGGAALKPAIELRSRSKS
jgi:hypothetical protein